MPAGAQVPGFSVLDRRTVDRSDHARSDAVGHDAIRGSASLGGGGNPGDARRAGCSLDGRARVHAGCLVDSGGSDPDRGDHSGVQSVPVAPVASVMPVSPVTPVAPVAPISLPPLRSPRPGSGSSRSSSSPIFDRSTAMSRDLGGWGDDAVGVRASIDGVRALPRLRASSRSLGWASSRRCPGSPRFRPRRSRARRR